MKEETNDSDSEKTNIECSVVKTTVNNNNNTENSDIGKEIKKEEEKPNLGKTDLKELIEETYLDCNLLYKEPNYAEICSFFNMFSSLLNIKPISFTKLEKNFCTLYNGNVDTELIDLHITLMRKIYLKYARADNFDSVLEKFCNICPALEFESLQLQRYSYGNLPLSIRLSILKALCESQFDCNIKFKENIFNTYQTYDLRLAPIGHDKNGLSYYYQQDCDLNIRIYTVEPDDLSGGTWALKAKSEKELLILIHKLKSPEFVKKTELKNEDEEIDEDQLLDGNNKLTDVKTKDETLNATHEEVLPLIEMTESEMSKIVTTTKRSTLWDLYRDASCIDKKKLTKESKKKQKEHCKATTSSNVELEIEKNKVETDEETEAINSSNRRIMPRRGARNSAINNIKAFTLSKTKNNSMKKETTFLEKTKDPYVKAGTSNESDFSEDENDEEIDSAHSSDDDFTLSESKSHSKTLSKNKKQKKRKSRQNSKNLVSNLSSCSKKSKQVVMNYDDEESSEDEEEEELKERRKATEETLCMDCRSSKRPDLLLLCDMCDDAWHTWCLKPKLWYVPDGDWFCPNCKHKTLIENLSFALIKLREALKVKEAETKKKQAAADRLKREIDFIGISLNNIIPSNVSLKNDFFSSSSVEDDGIRKSKKRAMKKVLSNKNRNNLEQNYCSSIVTIAEGRSRRRLTKVDYNFHAYDEQLQEAMKLSDSTKIEDQLNNDLIQDQDQNKGDFDGTVKEENNHLPLVERLTGAKPLANKASKRAKKTLKKKLTDLEIDDAILSSETDEYQESNDGEQTEDAEPSEDEYLPREFKMTRRSRRYKRTRSDDDFIDDNDSSDYENLSMKKKRKLNKRNNFGRRGRGKGRASKRGRNYSVSDEESSEELSEKFCSESSDENDTKRKRSVTKSKWGPKASTSEFDEDELEIPEELSCDEKTETGRPLRKAAVEMKKKMKDIESNFAKDEEFESDSDQHDKELIDSKIEQNKSQSTFKKKKAVNNDEDSEVEFQIDDEDEEDEESTTEQEKEDDLIKTIDETKDEENKINQTIKEINYSFTKNESKKVNKTLTANEKILSPIHQVTHIKPSNCSFKQTNILTSQTVNNFIDQKNNESNNLLKKTAENSKEMLKTTRLLDSPNKNSLTDDLLKPKRRGRGPGKKRFINASVISKAPNSVTSGCGIVHTPSTSHQIVKNFSSQLSTSTVPTELRLSSQTMPALNQQQQTVMASQLNTALSSTLPISGPANSSQPSIIHLKQVQTPSSISNPIHLQRSLQSNQVQHLSYSTPQYYRISAQTNRDETPSSQQYLPVPPSEAIPASSQYASSHYVQPPHYVPPQFVYQSLQPYGLAVAGPTPPQQMIIDPRTGQIIDQDSLGHALAGAMNPEDL